MSARAVRRIAVIGGGITGSAAAHALRAAVGGDIRTDSDAQQRIADVALFEAGDQVGGRIRASPFAGLDAVDEGADAVLARVPDAVDLAVAVGLTDQLVHPEAVGAAVWHDRLHPIPDGLLLGVPGRLTPLARSGLLSWRGKLRAAIEPLLFRQSLSHDAVGALIRGRFGDEVHERLVDALIGSIYATDTDRFSLAEVPQLDALARAHRSLLLGARRARAATATAQAAPIFAAPRGGVADLVAATAARVTALGGDVRLDTAVTDLSADADGGWRVNDERFDAVILTVPAHAAATAVAPAAPDAAAQLQAAETADVALVTLHVPADEWPERLRGLSGYLVPKPAQRAVTAVSFGSQKWAHWRPPGGGEILRVSLGRDQQPVLHLSDDELVERVLADLAHHLGTAITPLEVRISRWPGAFSQYRPHHATWVDAVERALPAGLFVAGAAYRGIGVPACVRQGRTIAERAARYVHGLAQ